MALNSAHLLPWGLMTSLEIRCGFQTLPRFINCALCTGFVLVHSRDRRCKRVE